MNVVSVNGGKVHSSMFSDGGDPYPLCRGGGMNQNLTKFTTTEAPLSCKTCITYAERRAAKLAAEPTAQAEEGNGEDLKFERVTEYGATQYRAEGASFRYTAVRTSDGWGMMIRRLETVAGLRVAKQGAPYEEVSADKLTLCKAIAGEFEALGDDYKAHEHGYRERITEATLRAYGKGDTNEGENMTTVAQAEAAPVKAHAPEGFEARLIGAGEMRTHAVKAGTKVTLCKVTFVKSMLSGGTAIACPECVAVLNGQGVAPSGTLAAHLTDNQGEIMAERNDVTTDEGKAVVEQIDANIERAASLAEAENVEGLQELSGETETLISSLSGKGSINVKKLKRDAFAAAATAQPKSKSAEVATAPKEGVVVKTWDQYEGVPELVAEGAKRVSDGVKAHVKIGHLARDIAEVTFGMWLLVPNKDSNPDLKGDSDPAKASAKAMYEGAGKGFERNFENEQALKKLQRSVQYYRTDVRAQWVRSLDEDTEEAAERRALVAKVLEGKPEDTPASVWVANAYDVSLKGENEKAVERYQEKKALEAGKAVPAEGEGEAEETTPDERVTTITKKLIADLRKANPDDFENASEETKEAARAQLEEAIKALRAMVTATL